MVQTGVDAVAAAHAEARDGAVVAVACDVEACLGHGDDLLQKLLREELLILEDEAAHAVPASGDDLHFAVAQRHDDDHGRDLAVVQQGVEDEGGLARLHPTLGTVGVAVIQVQHRVGLLARGIVARRGVHPHVAVAGVRGVWRHQLGAVQDVFHVTVRDVSAVPRLRRGRGDFHHGGGRDEVGPDRCVARIQGALTVHGERVAVNLRLHGRSGHLPYTVGILLQVERLALPLDGDGDLLRVRCCQPEGDCAGGGYVRRDDGCGCGCHHALLRRE